MEYGNWKVSQDRLDSFQGWGIIIILSFPYSTPLPMEPTFYQLEPDVKHPKQESTQYCTFRNADTSEVWRQN